MSYWSKCPRCGSGTFENLHTFSHCIECLYFNDSHISSEAGAFQAHQIQKEIQPLSKKTNAKNPVETEHSVFFEAI